MERKNGYHHGNLRRALIDATLELVETQGPSNVNVREAARRSGVSSGAPYKHFANKQELMTAVASEGLALQRRMLDAQLGDATGDLDRLREMGVAVVKFAASHPTYFRVMTMPEYFDPANSPELRHAIDSADRAIRRVVTDAQADGSIYPGDPRIISLAARALVYGLSRMFVDGLLATENIADDDAESIARAVTEVLAHGLAPRADDAAAE